MVVSPWSLSVLLVAAIGGGSALGSFDPDAGAALSGGVDATLLTLMALLFIEVRFGDLLRLRSAPRFLMVAWAANFVVIPAIGWAIASLFLSGQPLLFTGLLIYFVAPCTDWFLGFTRLAGGNTTLGAVLLPLNLISQLLLFPLFLAVFARTSGQADLIGLVQTLGMWFAVPLAIAVTVRSVITLLLPVWLRDRVYRWVGAAIPWVIAVLIVQIFAVHIGTILGARAALTTVLLALIVFFAATYLLAHGLTRIFRFGYPEQVLLTMTTAARNAPLMLALTMVALPGQPLIYAAIVIGMLVEFPHLTAIRALLLRGRRTEATPSHGVRIPLEA
jgi:ACR3 family arsenite transporter